MPSNNAKSIDPDTTTAAAPQSDELARIIADHPELLNSASLADAVEHDLTFRQAFHKHYRAALWSMFLSTALIMEGYDMGSISPPWQTGINNAALCGQIIGLAINGWAQERFGYKKTMLGALAALGCAIFVPVFAINLPMLCAGFIVEGIPWGIFQTLTTSYAAELCPQVLRPYLTSYVNLCWGVGFLLSSGVIRGTLDLSGDWSWRVPLILQWFWILVLPVGVFFAPEAPWWLVRNGRYEEAKQVTRRLEDPATWTEAHGEQQVALMRYTTALENARCIVPSIHTNITDKLCIGRC